MESCERQVVFISVVAFFKALDRPYVPYGEP